MMAGEGSCKQEHDSLRSSRRVGARQPARALSEQEHDGRRHVGKQEPRGGISWPLLWLTARRIYQGARRAQLAVFVFLLAKFEVDRVL
jgi:hypothetical protein